MFSGRSRSCPPPQARRYITLPSAAPPSRPTSTSLHRDDIASRSSQTREAHSTSLRRGRLRRPPSATRGCRVVGIDEVQFLCPTSPRRGLDLRRSRKRVVMPRLGLDTTFARPFGPVPNLAGARRLPSPSSPPSPRRVWTAAIHRPASWRLPRSSSIVGACRLLRSHCPATSPPPRRRATNSSNSHGHRQLR